MKTFRYSVRDKNGALKSGSLQAVDRADALQQLKAAGNVPVSVIEAHGQPAATEGVRLPEWAQSPVLRIAAVLLIVLAAVGIGFNRKRSQSSPKTNKIAAQVAVAAQNQQANTAANRSGGTTLLPQPAAGNNPPAPVDTPSATAPGSDTPPNKPAARTPEPVAQEPLSKPATPAFYQTQTEQLLAMITSVPPGVEMPPPPITSDLEDDYNTAATNVLVIDEDTTEEQAARLETVAWAKVDLVELVKQGWQPGDVLAELAAHHNEVAVLRRETSAELKRLVEEKLLPDVEFKSELKNINKQLEELGVSEITLDEIGLDEGD